MKRTLFVAAAAALLFAGALTTQAQAQATRTWVSGTGDDANPCSRSSPCKTFAGAMSKTTDCGEIDALDPGGYGTLFITKGIKIDGGGGEAGMVSSVLAQGTIGLTINNSSAACNYDVLRNLDINGLQGSQSPGTTGISVVAGKNLSLENVDIENFLQACINFQPASSMNLIMYNTNLENCAGGGIVSTTSSGTNRLNIDKSTIERSGVGITARANTDANVHRSSISNNPGGGVLADSNATGQVVLDECTVGNNQVFGVHATNSGIIRLTNSSVVFNNGTGLLADAGGQILTLNNNLVDGNTTNGTRTGLITPQ